MKATLLERARAGIPLTDVGIIDMHAHIGRPGFSIPATTADAIVKVMERTGVAKTVIAPMLPGSQQEAEEANRQILESLEAFPGRILGYMRPWPSSTPVSAREAEKRLDVCFTGIKLHNITGVDYTHPSYAPYLSVANERRMPVLFHSWGQEEEFAQFRALSAAYPDTSLILAHAGSENEEAYITIARESPNIYLDTVFSRGPRGLIERLVHGAGIEKIVWGSDVLFINQAQQLGKLIGTYLTDEEKMRILAGNAKSILGRILH